MTKEHKFISMRETDLMLLKELNAKSSRYSIFRVISFVAAILALAAGYDGKAYGYWGGFILLAVFIILVRRHNALKMRQLFINSHVAAVSNILTRFSDKWQALADDGSDFFTKDRPQDIDLHIFGAASIYQFLCAARTKLGRANLARSLAVVPPKKANIMARQLAVAEMLEHPLLCSELMARFRLLPLNHDASGLTQLISSEKNKNLPFIYRAMFILPLITIISLLLAVFNMVNPVVPGFMLTVQFVLTLISLANHAKILAPLGALSRELTQYTEIFSRLESVDFNSPTLKDLQKKLRTDKASDRLRALSALTTRAGFLRNMFFFVIGGTLLLWSFRCVRDFYKWCAASQNIAAWLEILAEVEVLLSLSMVGHTRKNYTFPKILAGAPTITAKNLSSLLISEKNSIANNADFAAGTNIISGSNMSGKTTYMRTLAASAVLAYSGAPVPASEFSLSPLYIFTSIQVNDDLSRGISTFYAELLRIKQMVEFSKNKMPMLILIDEIFKGTNSADRIVGATETIKRLTLPHTIVLVTTHDFELCDLRSPNKLPIANFHFEEYYENDKIKFDYKIKNGRCHTTNAKYLLKMAGIIS